MPKKNKKSCCSSKAIAIALILGIAVITVGYFSFFKKDGKAIAKVNGKKIYDVDVIEYLDNMYGVPANFDINSIPDEQKKLVIKQLYVENQVTKEAKSSKVAKSKEVKDKINKAKTDIIKEAYLGQMSNVAASRKNIENLYKERIEELKGKKEYKVQHILVKTKQEAYKARSALRYQSFEKVASDMSIDQYTKDKAGDIGYFVAGKMIKEFEDVVFNLKKNQISQPFKTRFGWHVVKLNDVRDAKIPEMNEIFDELKKELSYKAINDYLESIQENINVELLEAKKEEEKEEATESSEEKTENDQKTKENSEK